MVSKPLLVICGHVLVGYRFADYFPERECFGNTTHTTLTFPKTTTGDGPQLQTLMEAS